MPSQENMFKTSAILSHPSCQRQMCRFTLNLLLSMRQQGKQ